MRSIYNLYRYDFISRIANKVTLHVVHGKDRSMPWYISSYLDTMDPELRRLFLERHKLYVRFVSAVKNTSVHNNLSDITSDKLRTAAYNSMLHIAGKAISGSSTLLFRNTNNKHERKGTDV
jgi:hypothetical protein